MKRRSRKPSAISESLHQRLNAYALAANAAGVGLLALAQTAQAKIIYSPAHRVIEPKHSYDIDFNHDGIPDFKIANSVSACTDFCFLRASSVAHYRQQRCRLHHWERISA
jgi:hypothetical protein